MAPDGHFEPAGEARRLFRFGDAVFDERTQELRVAGEPRKLDDKARQLLRLLLLRPDAMLTKDELKQALWPEVSQIDDSCLFQTAYLLRTALGSCADLIKTKKKLGYLLAGPVEFDWVEPVAPLHVEGLRGHIQDRRLGLTLIGLGILAFTAACFAAVTILLEHAQATRAAEIAETAQRFLSEDLLAGSEPGGSNAGQSVVDALIQAEAKVDTRFAGDPRLAGSIHLAIANAFALRSMSDQGRRAYKAAIADFKASGPDGAEDLVIAQARAAFAEAQSLDAGSMERARSLAASASAALPLTHRRRIEANVDVLAAKGMISWMGGDPAQTHDLLDQASALAWRYPSLIDIDERLTLGRLAAASLMRMGRWNESEPLLEALLPQFLALGGPEYPGTLTVRLNLAQIMLLQGRFADALAAFTALRPLFISVFGPLHRLTLDVTEQRVASLEDMGRYEEALGDAAQLYHDAVAKSGERSYLAAGTLSDLSDIECRSGHTDEGVAAAQQSYEVAVAAVGEQNGMTQALKSTVVFCLGVAGRYADALANLAELNVKSAAEFMADPSLTAEMDLVRASSALDRGAQAEAAAALIEPRRILLLPGADPFDMQWTRHLISQLHGI